jgi:hypothetical protein
MRYVEQTARFPPFVTAAREEKREIRGLGLI